MSTGQFWQERQPILSQNTSLKNKIYVRTGFINTKQFFNNFTIEVGRQFAVKMARLIIKITQQDPEIREKLRPKDAGLIIAIGQTVATEFATIAAANNYWK